MKYQPGSLKKKVEGMAEDKNFQTLPVNTTFREFRNLGLNSKFLLNFEQI
jgi:hypothetical protein